MPKSALYRIVLASLCLSILGAGAPGASAAFDDTKAEPNAVAADTLAGAPAGAAGLPATASSDTVVADTLTGAPDLTTTASQDTVAAAADTVTAGAPQEGAHTYQAAEVTVTATRLYTTMAETPAEVTIVDRPEIEANAEKNLIGLLARKEGVNPGSYGSYGALELISLRGARSGRTPVALDGVLLNNAQNGDLDFNTVPSSLVQRIEIVRGPLGSLNGGNGIAGAVNLVTVEPEKDKPPLSLVGVSSGSLAYRKQIASFGRRLGRVGMILGIEDSGTDDTLPYKDYAARSFYGKVSYDLAERSRVAVLATTHTGTLKTVSAATQKTDATRLQVTGGMPVGDALTLQFAAFGSGERTKYIDQYSKTTSDLRKYGATADAAMRGTSWGDVVCGAGYVRNWLSARDLVSSWAPVTKEGYVFGGTRLRVGEWLKGLVSVRADFHSDYGSELSPCGSIWHDMRNGMVWFSFGRGFNPPTMNDLFWPTQTTIWGGTTFVTTGNSRVAGESSWMGEVGSRMNFLNGILRGGATCYASRTEDYIEWVSTVSDSGKTITYRPENSDQVDAVGAELALEASKAGWPAAGVNLSLQRVEDKEGVKVPYMPASRLNLSLAYGVEPFPDLKIELAADATHVGTYTEPLGSSQGPYFLLEGRLSGSLSGFTAFVRLRNATDTEYPSRSLMSLEEGRPAAYYPMQGRNYEIGILWKLLD